MSGDGLWAELGVVGPSLAPSPGCVNEEPAGEGEGNAHDIGYEMVDVEDLRQQCQCCHVENHGAGAHHVKLADPLPRSSLSPVPECPQLMPGEVVPYRSLNGDDRGGVEEEACHVA